MAQPFPLRPRDLQHLRQQLALLAARLERDGAAAPSDAPLRGSLQRLGEFTNALVHQVSLAEELCTRGDCSREDVQRFEEHYARARERIDTLGKQLDRTPVPARPDLDAKPKSSGSVVGDAVRDGFLNMGNDEPLSGREAPG